VITAEGGQEALERLSGEIHDVVSAEIKMPSMIGPQAAKRANESQTGLKRAAFIGRRRLARDFHVDAGSAGWVPHNETHAGQVESGNPEPVFPKDAAITGLKLSLCQLHVDAKASAAARTPCLT